MVKISEGISYQDTFARTNIIGAKAAGLMVGGYHFARPSVNGAIAEVEFCYKCLQVLPELTLFALDMEDDQVGATVDLAPWSSDWLEHFEDLTGMTSRLYSGPDYIAVHALGGIRSAAKWKLWLASWSSHEPTSPWPWQRVNGWQFEAGSTWPGISSVDLSIWDY